MLGELGNRIDPPKIKCVVFDFGFTLFSGYYFNNSPLGYPQWHEVIQEKIFRDPSIIDPWLKGDLTTTDIAAMLARYIPLAVPSIVETMEKGCQHLSFNPVVWNFAIYQKITGRKTALVTANMDVFTKVVVPCHSLDKLFDVILNTSDYRELRKEVLWPIAFEQLGNGIDYSNSLLIEDGETEPAKFRSLGGQAYQYSNDELFLKWLDSIQWDEKE